MTDRLRKTSVLALMLTALPHVLLAAPKVQRTAGQNLAVLLTVLIIALCCKLGCLAAAVLYAVLEPQKVQSGSRICSRSPARCLGKGALLLTIAFLCLGLTSVIPPPLNVVFLLPVIAATYLLMTGFAMITHGIGERLQSNMSSATIGSSAYAVLYGGSALLLINFLPVIGWALLFIASLVGLGAALDHYLAERRRKREQKRAAQNDAAQPSNPDPAGKEQPNCDDSAAPPAE